MKIIMKGDIEKAWPRRWRATCCNSVLEVEPDDIKHNSDYVGSHLSWFINCPVCGDQPDVPDEFHYSGVRWLRQQDRVAE